MNENKLEALSALMDGEATASDTATLDNWSRDESLRAAWGRYHLISDSLRGHLPRYLDPALSNRISVALRNEPAVLAPDFSAPRPWLKPLAGMAIAASVATLAVIGIQFSKNSSDAGFGQPVANRTMTTSGGSGGQINLAAGTGEARPLRRPETMDRANAQERTKAAGQGIPPYVRAIPEGQDEQQQ